MRPVVLCFSGLDPSGGAGLQADIETVASLGGHAAVVCTALTVQDTNRVYGFEPVAPALIRQQAEKVLADLPVAAIKLGMLGTGQTARAIGEILAAHPGIPVVLDPVLAANTGGTLAQDDLLATILALLPRATLVTPNSVELRRLTGQHELIEAVVALRGLGAANILLKGGHEPGPELLNQLFDAHGLAQESRWMRLPGEYHGSGCTLAAAIACGLAAGKALPLAVAEAESYVYKALGQADRPREQGQFLPVRVPRFL